MTTPDTKLDLSKAHDAVIRRYQASHGDFVDGGPVPFLLNLELALIDPEDPDHKSTIAQARQGTEKLNEHLMQPGETFVPPDLIQQRREIRDTLASADAGTFVTDLATYMATDTIVDDVHVAALLKQNAGGATDPTTGSGQSGSSNSSAASKSVDALSSDSVTQDNADDSSSTSADESFSQEEKKHQEHLTNMAAIDAVAARIPAPEYGEHPVSFFSRVVRVIQEAGHDVSDAFHGVGLNVIDTLPVGTHLEKVRGGIRLITAEGHSFSAPTTREVLTQNAGFLHR